MGNKENVYGEGNYDASRKYNDATPNIPAQPDSKRSETAPEEPVAPQPGEEV
jgi:hypothetical protein